MSRARSRCCQDFMTVPDAALMRRRRACGVPLGRRRSRVPWIYATSTHRRRRRRRHRRESTALISAPIRELRPAGARNAGDVERPRRGRARDPVASRRAASADRSLCRRRNAGTSSGETGSNSAPGADRARRRRRVGARAAARAPAPARQRHAATPPAGGDRSPASCFQRGVRAAGRPASALRDAVAGCDARRARSKPVAITVIFTLPSSVGSTTAPKMMLASSCAASWMIADASLTSTSDRSGPPVTLMITPRAPLTDAPSSSGLEIARLRRFHRAVLAFGDAGAHHREAHAGHDRLHVGEVEVDQAGHEDQIRDALNRLPQHVVGRRERVGQRRRAIDDRRAAARSGS